MKPLLPSLLTLSLLLLNSPLFGQEIGVLYQYATSTGIKWKTFGNEKVHPKNEGEVKIGFPNGQGTYAFLNGDKYQGEWKEGEQVEGIHTWSDGYKYVGSWKGG